MHSTDVTLNYDETGEGLPVILIHGFPLCRQMWRPQFPILARAGFRVICPDLPGFGETPAVRGPITMETFADAVIDLLDQLGIERAVVGGMSMGGYVLFNLLDRYRERCMAALFLLTRAAADDSAGREKRTALAEAVRNGNLHAVPDTFAQVLFAPQTPREQPELVTQVRSWMESTSVDGVVGGLLAMRDRTDYLERLAEFDLPALVIGAERDLAVPVAHAQVLAERLPQSTFTVLTGAGHMANLERPEAFNQAVLNFLTTL